MNNSKKLFSDAKKVIPSGVNSPVRYFEPYPFFVKRSQGSSLWDEDGRKLVDFCNGYGALLLGHTRKEIITAVSNQMKKGTLYTAPTTLEIELSKLIMNNFPSMQKVRTMNTGAEATMTAIRLARGFTKKKKIIKFEGCYHGAYDTVLVQAGSGSAHNGISVSDGGLDEVSRNTLVVPYNDIDELEKILSKNKDVAGLIVEPVLANMGLVMPEKNFLKDLRKITKQFDVPLIFDEVVNGFRISEGGAQKTFGIKPDITTLGKALGNGYGITAIIGKKEIMDHAQSSFISSTFWTERIGFVAAIKTIEIMEKTESYKKLIKNGKYINSCWKKIAKKHNLKIEISGIESITSFQFNKNNRLYKTYISQEMLKKGYLASNLVYLSTLHTKEVIDKYIKCLDEVFENISSHQKNRKKKLLISKLSHNTFKRLTN